MGKNEKYFIKDEALKTSDEDYFGHIDLANNIHRMIVHTEAPFNRKEYENSQRIARIIAVIECGSILIFFFGKIETSYILYMSFGIILSAILLALGKIIGQEVKAV